MIITRSRIKAIGKKLRALGPGHKLSASDLRDLSYWRDSHGASLNYIIKLIEKVLREKGVKDSEYFLAQRLKRIYSIKVKLRRFQNMQLSMMDDIAGARAILKDIKTVNLLFNELKEKV